MKHLFVGVSVALCITSSGAAPSATEIAMIRAAAPDRPSAAPQKPRKVLVFSKFYGFNHTAVPYGKVAFEVIGSKTDAYTPMVSDDDAMFEPDNLSQFDAVVFNNTNNEIFLPEPSVYEKLSPEEKAKADARDARLKASLVDYLKRGGGLAVLHAGVASFRQWPEYGEIIGARFDNHPWVAGSTVTFRIEEPEHPLARAFRGREFVVQDEIYQFKEPYSRDLVRVIVSLDTTKTNMNVRGVHRTDGDFPMTWVKPYGKGRVFYCSLGHQHDIFWNPVVLRHLLDGVQFVLGDLVGPIEPRR